MNKTKFLHIGDIHLDSKLVGLDAKKRFMRQHEILETIRRILTENNDTKYVFFTGDIFDGEYNKSTVTYLCKLFEEHTDKLFFISCGNHDYLSCESTKKLIQLSPSNVHIFSDSIDCFEFFDDGLRIYGCSFSEPHLYSSLLTGFKAKKDELVNIMLLHGDVSSNEAYNPLEISDITQSGLNYLALGHKHKFSGINEAGITKYAYAGILEPRGFDECGECGIIKGEIIDRTVNVEFSPENLRSYEIIDVDISGIQTTGELIEKINDCVGKNNLYRIILSGTCNENLKFDTGLLESSIDVFYCEVFDKTSSETDIFGFSGEKTLRGKTAEILDKYILENKFDDEDVQQNVIKILTKILCEGGNN